MSIYLNLKKQSEDTLFRGFFCGFTAGVLKDLIDYFLYILNAKEHVFWDFSSILAFHRPPQGLLMHASALILELIFCSLLGFIFALLAQKLQTRHYALLGIIYGSLIWFFIKGVIVILKIDEMKSYTIYHNLNTWFLSMFFGLVVSLLERRLSPKTS